MSQKYALITHHDENYLPLAEATWEGNKIKYAKIHNYGYHCKTKNWTTKTMTGFEKIHVARDILNQYPNYEWIWWTGTDSLITNFNIRIEDKIDNNYHFVVATDILGINADSFLVRNTEQGRNFLDEILKLEVSTANFWDTEQRAISNLLGFPGTGEQNWPFGEDVKITNQYKNIVKLVPQRTMNAFNYYLYDHYKNVPHRDRQNTDGNWQFGDWLIHWPATSLDFRLELAEYYQNFIVGIKINSNNNFVNEPLITNIETCPVCNSNNLIKSPATMDRWTLNRFLRLDPPTTIPQGTINHCQDCDYAGFSYRFSKESEKDYYNEYMMGEYLESRASVEGKNIIEYSHWYHSLENVKQFDDIRSTVLSQFINPKEIKSILDYGGNTGLMIPSIFNHCEKYIHDIQDQNLENVSVKIYNNQKVDLIFCAHTLEHISDIKSTIEEFKNCLNPNGLVYIEVPKELFPKNFNKPYHFYEHINLFTETALMNVLKLNGFDVFPVQTVNHKPPMDVSIAVLGKLI